MKQLDTDYKVGDTVIVDVAYEPQGRRGKVVRGPLLKWGDDTVWRIEFASGAQSWMTARELRRPDVVTRLADLV